MAGYQGNIEESKDSQSKDDSQKKPEDTCLMVETSEITLVPNNVKVPLKGGVHLGAILVPSRAKN